MMIAPTDCEESSSLKRKVTSDHVYTNGNYHTTSQSRPLKRRRLNGCWQSGSQHCQNTSPERASPARLTKAALRKFNKIQAQSNPAPLASPVIVDSTGEKGVDWLIQPADEFLRSCDTETLKHLELFASDGGPALLHLRGVSLAFDIVNTLMRS